MACSGVMVSREIVVKWVMLSGCARFRVGIGIRVKWVLPWGERDVVQCVAGVFFLEVIL